MPHLLRLPSSLVAVLLYVAAPALAHAAPSLCAPQLPSLRADAACPELFGDAAARAQNGQARRAALESVYRGTNTIWVTESADWQAPKRVSFHGLAVTETDVGPGCEPVAVITVAPGVAAQCVGSYVVRQDDSLGADGRVLAITSGAMLLELDGALRFAVAEGAPDPVWRMVWHPDWTFEERSFASPAPVSPYVQYRR